MKKQTLLLALLFMLLCGSSALAAKARGIQTEDDSRWHAQHLTRHIDMQDLTCTGNYVKVRVSPRSEDGYGHLEQADQFLLLDVEDGFAKIRVIRAAATSPDSYDGLTGWVNADYVNCPCSDSAYAADVHDSVLPAALPLYWIHSSGAGAWQTEMTILPDGTFSGYFSDSEMGDYADSYPNGTVYESRFRGRFSDIVRIDATTYAMTVAELTLEGYDGKTAISDGIRYVTTEPAGLRRDDLLLLYLPQTPSSDIAAHHRIWIHEELGSTLGTYFLYNLMEERGFVAQ